MSTTAFPVRQDSEGVGCTDITLRKIFQALYPDKGIITGLGVSGQNSTSYKVAAGVAVCSKGSSDGNTLAYYEGGTVATSANTASNPRIDVIWITSHDVTQGDDDNFVTIGVTKGTAAASPSVPSIPSYATKLCAMKVPAGATTTSSATKYGSEDVAIPYGASLGLVTDTIIQKHNSDWGSKDSWQQIADRQFSLPTKRIIQFNVTITAGANNGAYADGDASLYSRLYDGSTILDTREVRLRKTGNAISTFYQITVELTAGTHYLKWSLCPNQCSSIHMYYQDKVWAGQQIQVVDLGPVD